MSSKPEALLSASEEPLFNFPESASPELTEWPGSQIGLSNTITRTKGRTSVQDKTVDTTPGLLDHLLKCTHDHIQRASARQPVFTQDAIIHGIRVRAVTNSPHLNDFWTDNWYSVKEWQQLTGEKPASQPHVHVYALNGVSSEREAAYYSNATNTIVFFNTSYYGQLKSWVLGAVGRILAREFGIHSIHGACVEKAGKGVLYIAPTGTGKSTSSYGLMRYAQTRFHSDDWVYVRYAYAARDGRRVLVLGGEASDGSKARGYEVYRWIERHASDANARLAALTLDNHPLDLTISDLDLERGIQAYAYTSEKVFYLRTNLVENFPLAAVEIMSSKEENVPDISDEFIHRHRAKLENIVADLKDAHNKALAGIPAGELEQRAGRLIAFDNARAMLDITRVLGRERVYVQPLEPLKLAAVMLLKRNPEDRTVLTHALLESFMEKLLIGETPDRKRETAYNAYRAVDDTRERAFIDGLEHEASPSRPLYTIFSHAQDVPESLQEEFELFRVMYYAARTYELNTILERDPQVPDKRHAVERTLRIIARTLEEEPVGIRLTLDDYSGYIE